ncbi:MAG TPA: hypothetical protein VHC39_00495 [Rhizomicrobium sp.]|nr:hypothetical protein [Rhizomicrobium sp.]
MRRYFGFLVAARLFFFLIPAPAFAWGFAGHQMISEAAARQFPAELPPFLRTELAVRQIARLAQEPDISRGSGQPHDADLDPGHFLDLSDDGTILGGPKLSALPPTREDYDTALRAVGGDEYKAGFLPYNIMDGYEQLVHDFALLRAYRGALAHARDFHLTQADRQGYAELVSLRELITLRDLGYWAHFVEDASQPMHVSIHYNGWGNGPNPQGFVTTAGLHAKFESTFVAANIRQADIAARMTPPRACDDPLQICTRNYLAATGALVAKVYQLEKQGAFDIPTPESRAFTAERMAAAASMLRDRVVDAWRASAQVALGSSQVKTPVADYEAGKALFPLQSQN